MSIKIQDIIANEVLPLSRFSTIGTEDAPWNSLYGSFGLIVEFILEIH